MGLRSDRQIRSLKHDFAGHTPADTAHITQGSRHLKKGAFFVLTAFFLLSYLVFVVTMDKNSKNTTFNVIVTTEGIVRDPIEAKGYQQFQVLSLYLNSLVRKSPEFGIVKSVAKSWSIDESQTVYDFIIDEKAKFHDGEQILPADIIQSFQRHLDKGSPSILGGYLSAVLEEIVETSQGIRFILKGPYPPFLEMISMPGFGITKIDPKSGEIVGSGPYVLSDVKNKKWCLKKHPNENSNSVVAEFCFRVERDIEKTIEGLNSEEIDLAMGSPLEVSLSDKLDSKIIAAPYFSLVATHAYLNHSNPWFQNRANRIYLRDTLYKTRSKTGVLTKFDKPLNTFLPEGIMNDDYYEPVPDIKQSKNIVNNMPLRVVFPYGIFLASSVQKIIDDLNSAGFLVTHHNVKGKELLDKIQQGDFDLIFLPYQGIIADPDGYLDLISPTSLLRTAHTPTNRLLEKLSLVRFSQDRLGRLNQYSSLFKEWEREVNLIPFSQNGIPIVFNKSVKSPDLNYSFHLDLRELRTF